MKYKVGDKVRIKNLDWYNQNKDKDDNVPLIESTNSYYNFIELMRGLCGKVMTISSVNSNYYDMVEDYGDYFWTDEMIEGLAEEETKPNIIEEAKTYWDSIKDAWICPEGYQFKDENGNVINTTKIVLEKKRKEYPKTYEECAKELGYNQVMPKDHILGYKGTLLSILQQLIICRDAYWKMAGAEMGLGKPWEPNWTSLDGYPAIYMYRYQITLSVVKDEHHCLVFPTTEMRDAFYENFKELIESVKEFL